MVQLSHPYILFNAVMWLRKEFEFNVMPFKKQRGKMLNADSRGNAGASQVVLVVKNLLPMQEV